MESTGGFDVILPEWLPGDMLDNFCHGFEQLVLDQVAGEVG